MPTTFYCIQYISFILRLTSDLMAETSSLIFGLSCFSIPCFLLHVAWWRVLENLKVCTFFCAILGQNKGITRLWDLFHGQYGYVCFLFYWGWGGIVVCCNLNLLQYSINCIYLGFLITKWSDRCTTHRFFSIYCPYFHHEQFPLKLKLGSRKITVWWLSSTIWEEPVIQAYLLKFSNDLNIYRGLCWGILFCRIKLYWSGLSHSK